MYTNVAQRYDKLPPEHGLVFDGDVRGRFTGEAVQHLAEEYGYGRLLQDADYEWYDEAVTEAEDWLNENIAEEGSIFHFVNGSFFYEKLEWIKDRVWS